VSELSGCVYGATRAPWPIIALHGWLNMSPRWYAIHSQPRKEAEAETQLARQGFEVWLPRIGRRVRKRGLWTLKVEPLFSRYLFLRVDPEAQDVSPVRSTRGVTDFVRVAGRPQPIPERVIEGLKTLVDPTSGLHELSDVQAPALTPGSAVEILEGPFAGLKGVFQEASGEARAMILLRILGQPAVVKLDQSALQAL